MPDFPDNSPGSPKVPSWGGWPKMLDSFDKFDVRSRRRPFPHRGRLVRRPRMNEPTAKARDYSETLFLPRTDFPMRAGLPQKEPEILARWQKLGLYERLRAAAKGRPRFVLHDGPPYANGNIHIGHALNKILKDVVTRSQQML